MKDLAWQGFVTRMRAKIKAESKAVTIDQLKKAINLTNDIRENSFNYAAADVIKYSAYPDFTTCYNLSLIDAATQACKELDIPTDFAQPISMLLASHDDIVLDWADE